MVELSVPGVGAAMAGMLNPWFWFQEVTNPLLLTAPTHQVKAWPGVSAWAEPDSVREVAPETG